MVRRVNGRQRKGTTGGCSNVWAPLALGANSSVHHCSSTAVTESLFWRVCTVCRQATFSLCNGFKRKGPLAEAMPLLMTVELKERE